MSKSTKLIPAGDVLVREGDVGEEAYCVLSGKLEVSKSQGDTKIILGYRSAGDIIGEMALIQELPRMATITAVKDSEVEILTKDYFIEILRKTDPSVVKMLFCLFERLRESGDGLVTSLVPSGDQADAGTDLPLGKIKITPQTPAAKKAIGSDGIIVENFPYKIGRCPGSAFDQLFNKNDLDLQDEQPHEISRSHIKIEWANGRYLVHDRGSKLGASVNGIRIGRGGKVNHADLTRGHNNLILGGKKSAYRFSIIV